MTNQSHINTATQAQAPHKSLLDKFSIGFEYDKTWVEAKRYTQSAPTKNKR